MFQERRDEIHGSLKKWPTTRTKQEVQDFDSNWAWQQIYNTSMASGHY